MIREYAAQTRMIRSGDGGCEELMNLVLLLDGQSHDEIDRMGPYELKQARRTAMDRQLSRAQVLACTCVGAGAGHLDGPGYDLVFIDEASQVTEPSALVALQRAGKDVKQVVMLGDHKQLPPTVFCDEEALSVSLFERLIDEGVEPVTLVEQWRMHSQIAKFPSQAFYHGWLLNATDDNKLQSIGATKSNVELVHVAPLQQQGNETKRGPSACNEQEAARLVEYLRNLEVASPKNAYAETPASIGILTPYLAQKQEIEDLLRRDRSLSRLNIEVDTIDGFQGMEKDLILFSATRSNPHGSVGFLADPRRMNVMLTRAKKSLVIFADGTTLEKSGSPYWEAWLKWARQNAAITGDDFPESRRSEQNKDFEDTGTSGGSTWRRRVDSSNQSQKRLAQDSSGVHPHPRSSYKYLRKDKGHLEARNYL
ncbi:unnamed protein product [Amoebophrya sp. A25]|nr:unnamed protein product [Amoebophrya sp. A25]|eukprot:GSA25T00006399001.1